MSNSNFGWERFSLPKDANQKEGSETKMSEPSTMKGACGRTVRVKVWKHGHSFTCEGYGRCAVRYWKPDTIESELEDFCKYCTQNPKQRGT